MPRPRRLLSVPWAYPRPASTVAVAGVAVGTTVVVRAALPRALRPAGAAPTVLAAAAAYAAVRVGAHKGWTKTLKHDLLDRLGGDVDDSTTPLVAAVAGAGALVSVQLSRRACARARARRPTRSEPRAAGAP